MSNSLSIAGWNILAPSLIPVIHHKGSRHPERGAERKADEAAERIL
jgi:hypothetical protein